MKFRVARSLLLFSISCLWVTAADGEFAFSHGGPTDSCSTLELEEDVSEEGFGVDLLHGPQAVLEFEQAYAGLLVDLSVSMPRISRARHLRVRGPPSGWL